MSIKRTSINELVQNEAEYIIIDVRSPGEFNHAHIPNAYNIPLFTDEERKVVGTAYKHHGKQPAIKIGLDYFGVKMKTIVENVEKLFINHQQKKLLVHCWRGGMRSAAIAWLLELYGFDIVILNGGYKSFRNWALQQFDIQYKLNILGGFTGSAKTDLIAEMIKKGIKAIDLEGIAIHKGSAFGGIGLPDQPSQEMFENKLALALYLNNQHFSNKAIWLEDESQRIGSVNIPHKLWDQIRKSPLYFIEIPFEERLDYILQQYGPLNIEDLINSVGRITKRLGPNETKKTIAFLKEHNIREAFRMLLIYYDKNYLKAMNKREHITELLTKIYSDTGCSNHNIHLIQPYL